MLRDDSPEAKVKTSNTSIFPKNTIGRVLDCRFVPNTSVRVYLFQTTEHIIGLVDGAKTEWYLERDLENA